MKYEWGKCGNKWQINHNIYPPELVEFEDITEFELLEEWRAQFFDVIAPAALSSIQLTVFSDLQAPYELSDASDIFSTFFSQLSSTLIAADHCHSYPAGSLGLIFTSTVQCDEIPVPWSTKLDHLWDEVMPLMSGLKKALGAWCISGADMVMVFKFPHLEPNT